MDAKSDLTLKVQQQECMGAVSIIIKDTESRSRAGVAVLYRDSNKIRTRSTNKKNDNDGDDEAAEGLTLLVTDGKDTYHCEIDVSQIKMTKAQIQQDFESAPPDIGPTSSSSHSQSINCGGRGKEGPTKAEWVCQILLQSNNTNEEITQSSKTLVTYKSNDGNGGGEDSSTNGIEMSMKHSKGSIVRVISKQYIRKQHGTLGSMPFIQAIAASMTFARQQETRLSLELQKTSKRLLSWKKTAEQLHDSKWQKERDLLMNNFLVLLNNTKGTLRDVKSQLKEQQQNNLKLQEKIKRLESGKHMQREIVMDHVDEHDCQIFDEEMVDMLAGNTSVNKKATNRIISMRKSRTDGKADSARKSSSTAATVAAASRSPVDRKRKRNLSNTVSSGSSTNLNEDAHAIRGVENGASQRHPGENNHKSKNGGVRKINETTQSQSQSQSLSQSCLQSSQQSWRKNQYTGTIEMWGVEAILQDGDDAKPKSEDVRKVQCRNKEHGNYES